MIALCPSSPILVVDDCEADRCIAQYALRRSRLPNPIVLFSSGKAILAHMDQVQAGEQSLPALILLDVNMPGLNGFDVLEALRSREMFRSLPMVAMLTSSDAESDRDTAQALGADAYMAKRSGMAESVEMFDAAFESRNEVGPTHAPQLQLNARGA